MAGDQKEAAKKRTAAFLKKDPDHFKKLAAKRKGKKNPSKTKFTKKTAAKHGAKGGSAGKGKSKKRKKLTQDELIQQQKEFKEKVHADSEEASKEFQEDMHKKMMKGDL